MNTLVVNVSEFLMSITFLLISGAVGISSYGIWKLKNAHASCAAQTVGAGGE